MFSLSPIKGFSIRKIVPEDVELIKQLELGSGLASWSIEDYSAEVFREDSLNSAAIADSGEIIGFYIARLIMLEVEIYNFAVAPEARRRKIGNSLLTNLIDRSLPLGAEKISLEVRRSNVRAIEFYQSCGFSQIGIRKDFYQNPTEDALLMNLQPTG